MSGNFDVDSAGVREARARRAAKRVGLLARKSRQGVGTIDNLGGFRLIDPDGNFIVAGERFDLDPDEIIELCQERE